MAWVTIRKNIDMNTNHSLQQSSYKYDDQSQKQLATKVFSNSPKQEILIKQEISMKQELSMEQEI